MEEKVLGEFKGFTLFYEEIWNGGIGNWVFLGAWARFHVEGGHYVFALCDLRELI
jgi:hypothetical protein